MAVAGLLTEMEDRLDIVIDDDDVDGEMLETYGGLLAFAEAKTSSRADRHGVCHMAPPTPDGRSGEEMVLGFDKARKLRLLVIPPLFEEANKFRHQVTEIMRRLDEAGVDCFCPDLPGCNESLAPFAAQTLAGWREAATRASAYFPRRMSLRCAPDVWLAPESLPGWLYAPAKPATVLRTMLRARAQISAREAGREVTANDLLAQGYENGIELPDGRSDPALVAELEQEEFAPRPSTP